MSWSSGSQCESASDGQSPFNLSSLICVSDAPFVRGRNTFTDILCQADNDVYWEDSAGHNLFCMSSAYPKKINRLNDIDGGFKSGMIRVYPSKKSPNVSGFFAFKLNPDAAL